MELRQLRYFVAVAEAGTFTRAAERLGIAQPSLSQQIARLEDELGAALFDRFGRSISLTETGRALRPRAENILRSVREAERDIRVDVAEGRGALAVGAIPTIAPYLLPRVVKSFRKRCPEAELSLREDLTENLVASLKKGELDLAILSPPIDDDQIELEDLFHEPFLVAAPADHPLARAKTVPIEGLESERVVVLHEMHCLGQQMESFCRARGLQRRIVCRTTQLATVQEMVALGLGVSLCPKMAADADSSKRRAYLPLRREKQSPAGEANSNRAGRTISIAWRKGRIKSTLAAAFANILSNS